MRVKIFEEAENETPNMVERVTVTAETPFEALALSKLAELLSGEEGYEQLISFLFGSREKALELHQCFEGKKE